MNEFLIAVFAALLAASGIFVPSTASASKMVWIYPPPNSLIVESPTPFVGYVDGWKKKSLLANIALEGGGEPKEQELTVFKGKIFSGQIELQPGKNIVQVGGDELVLFYKPGFEGNEDGGFKKPREHDGLFKSCGPCHGFKDGDLVKTGRIPYVCISCHDDMKPALDGALANSNIHPRKVTFDCISCHEPHVSFYSNLLKAEADSLCELCHPSQAAKEDIHPAYDEGGCLLCHDAHSSEVPGLLTKTAVDLCTECHDKASERLQTQYHPPAVRGRACANCHPPHGTMENMIPSDPGSLCLKCHPKILDKGHGADLSECTTCHDPHGKTDIRLIRPNIAEVCGECHDGIIGEDENVHAAIEEYGCNVCHNPHRDDNVQLAKTACSKCHNFSRSLELSSVHGRLPIPADKCVLCHAPHSSKQNGLMRSKLHKPMTQSMCTSCHFGGNEGLRVTEVAAKCRKCHSFIDSLYDQRATIHPPVSQGKCVVCHQPHMSDESGLLRVPQLETCGKCHDVARPPEGRELHPAAETCTDCHDPHGAVSKKFLKTEPPELCIDCHDDPREAEGEVHPAIEEEGCLACHNPHYGFEPGLLKGDVPWIPCFSCHENMLEGKENIHPAVEEEGCSGCHDPHASPNDFFLKEAGNAMCLSCHDLEDHHVLSEEGTDVEVPKSFPRSGNEFFCAGCHSPHASNEETLMVKAREKLCTTCHEPYE